MSRRAAENRQARNIFIASSVALVSIFVALVLTRPPERDPETGCATGRGLAAHTVLIVDQSDAFTARQVQYAQVAILQEYDRLHMGDKLTVLALSDDPDAPARQFSACRLRRGQDVLGFAANPADVQRQFEEIVGGELTAFIDGLRTAPTSRVSPIVETVAAAAEASDFSPGPTERRLVLISDMAQHSALMSHYGGTSHASGLAALRRDLRGMNVRIHYLRRTEGPVAQIQGASHQAFWREYFEDQGATVRIGWGQELIEASEPRGAWESFVARFGGGRSEPAPELREPPPQPTTTAEFEAPSYEPPPAVTLPSAQPQTAPAVEEKPAEIAPSPPPVSQTEAIPSLIDRPVWARRPSRTQASAAYPLRALEREREGAVTLDCIVVAAGALRCVVVSERPQGYEFAESALSLAQNYRMAATDADGVSTNGRHVTLQIPFRLSD